MAEVLDALCAKRGLTNPKDYALVLDMKPGKLFVPLDRTVKSLQGKRDLMLIKKAMLQAYGVDMGKRIMGRSTDPNGALRSSYALSVDELDGIMQLLSSNAPPRCQNSSTRHSTTTRQRTRCVRRYTKQTQQLIGDS